MWGSNFSGLNLMKREYHEIYRVVALFVKSGRAEPSYRPLGHKAGALPIELLYQSKFFEIFFNFIYSCFDKYQHFRIHTFEFCPPDLVSVFIRVQKLDNSTT